MDPKDAKKEFVFVYPTIKHEPSYWDTHHVDDCAANLSAKNKAAWEETAALLDRVMRK
jgi:hypothetical protein